MSTATAIPLSEPLIADDADEKARTGHSTKRLARIAGALYLIVGIFGGFAVGYANPSVYVPGDAATTASNVATNAGLVRAAVLADLLQATAFVFLAMVLYVMLKDVTRSVARAMVVLVAIATTMICPNQVFQFSALLVATDASYVAAFGAAGSDALVMLLMDMFHYGFLMAQIFFGLWLIPLGYLAYKSAPVPEGAGRRPGHRWRVVPGRPGGGVPAARPEPPDPRLAGHPAGDRRDRHGRLPAVDRVATFVEGGASFRGRLRNASAVSSEWR